MVTPVSKSQQDFFVCWGGASAGAGCSGRIPRSVSSALQCVQRAELLWNWVWGLTDLPAVRIGPCCLVHLIPLAQPGFLRGWHYSPASFQSRQAKLQTWKSPRLAEGLRRGERCRPLGRKTKCQREQQLIQSVGQLCDRACGPARTSLHIQS